MNNQPLSPILIYPEFRITDVVIKNGRSKKEHHIEIGTSIRIKHEGKWYLSSISERYHDRYEELPASQPLIKTMRRFHRAVYLAQNFTKVDIQAEFNNKLVYKLDPNQSEESERLEVFYNVKS